MLVDDPPDAPISKQAHRCPHPETDRPASRLGSSAQPVEAMAKGEVAAEGYAEIARPPIDRPLPRAGPRLPLLEIHSTMGKGRRQIEYGCVLRIRRNHTSRVLDVMGLVDTFDERADIGFISLSLV